jgi:hypothetical protein
MLRAGQMTGVSVFRMWIVRAAVALGVVAAVVAVGSAVASGRATGSSLPLTAHVLHAGDFLGLRPQGPVVVVRSPEQWALTEPPGGFFDTALLRKDGFAGGIFEQLRWQARNIEGLSMVVQLGSPAAARKYLTIYNGLAVPFPVAGIPGAHGFGDQGGINIVFADRDYAYLIGAGWKPASTHPVTKAQLLAATTLLYHRVHGH